MTLNNTKNQIVVGGSKRKLTELSKELKKEGIVEKAYADCGFLNPLASEWREVTLASR